jgi:NADH-quinone oxidoreductase subunit J
MITFESVAFFVLAAVAVASGLGVVLNRNAVYCMLSLIVNLLSLAFFFLLLQAIFVATIQVLIYAGAVMVLFLFVVTMLTPDAASVGGRDRLRWQWGAAAGLAVILAGGLAFALASGAVAADAKATGANSLAAQVNCTAATCGNVEAFGMALFHGFAFPFELTSVVLVIAVLGAVALGRRVVRQEQPRTRGARGAAREGPIPTGGTVSDPQHEVDRETPRQTPRRSTKPGAPVRR